jgi:glutamate dehydrogenase/leucine dehydrogenase
MYVLEQAAGDMDFDLHQCRIVLQGFGNVGSWFARIAEERGARIVAVADHKGGVYNDNLLDIAALTEYAAEHRTVAGFPGGEPLAKEDIFEIESDVLVPAAVESVITAENAPRIKTRLILEAANHPITPDGDAILNERNIPVLPDLLVNAGGVTVSYFEWTQNLQQFHWTEEHVNEELHQRMVRAYRAVAGKASEGGITFREAAVEIGVERVARAVELRGFV